ncbi:MAG: formate dehydrogenase accessory sulfurtransferase FdhD [Gammaproteobacteria bacterium]|nr:formate dehydrogenase accessory sulfurtransferase FdhD [Gammaproteobacteria bacterium]
MLVKLPAQTGKYSAQHWDGTATSAVQDVVAEEVPVGLFYNGVSHAVMLATPHDLEDFAFGFSLSEGLVPNTRDIYDVHVRTTDMGIQVLLTVAENHFLAIQERRRTLAGRTGCGICGTESLEQVLRPLPAVPKGTVIHPDALHRAFAELPKGQRLNTLTGAVHAAAWATPTGEVQLVREDVGRHNALDKLIGAMAKQGVACDSGFAVLTSRASCEMVQKAATVGIPLLAAISAPTGLAIRLAQQSGLTLVGFARQHGHTVYAGPERIQTNQSLDCA